MPPVTVAAKFSIIPGQTYPVLETVKTLTLGWAATDTDEEVTMALVQPVTPSVTDKL